MKRAFCVFFLLALHLDSNAQFEGGGFSSNDGAVLFGTGLLSYDLLKNTKEASAASSVVGTNYILPVQLQIRMQIAGYQIAPRFLYTVKSVEAPDKGSSSKIFLISLPVINRLSPSIEWTAGLGYMIRSISGEGGTIVLDNGLSNSTFALPGRSVSSQNFLLELGLTYQFSDRYFGAFEFLSASPLSSKRSFNALFTLSYSL